MAIVPTSLSNEKTNCPNGQVGMTPTDGDPIHATNGVLRKLEEAAAAQQCDHPKKSRQVW